MKKIIKMFKYSILPFTLLSAIIAVPLSLVSCSSNEVFTTNTYTIEIEDVKKIKVNVQDRNVTVNKTEGNKIKIDYFYSNKEYYDITNNVNNELEISSAYNYDISDYFGSKSPLEYRNVNLWIPNDKLLDLNIITTNATIKCNNINTINSILLNSKGGNINFSQLDSTNSIDLIVKNGNINGNLIGTYESYAITCEIKKGNSNLPNKKLEGIKKLNVNCNNGDVEIKFNSSVKN